MVSSQIQVVRAWQMHLRRTAQTNMCQVSFWFWFAVSFCTIFLLAFIILSIEYSAVLQDHNDDEPPVKTKDRDVSLTF